MSLPSPTRLMENRAKAKSTDFATFLLRCHDSKGCAGVCMRSLVFLGTLGSVIYAGSVLLYCAHNVHVRFWMGDLIIVSLSIYLAALVPATLMLIYKICLTSHQRHAKDLQRALGRSAVQEEFSCRCSAKTLRFILLVMTFLAALAAIMAYCVVSSGMNVSSTLMLQCGKVGISQALAQKDAALLEFRSGCTEGRALDICQGFTQAFPPPAPYVSYIKVMEYELDCAGWCDYHKPFFNMDAAQFHDESCALRLGHHLWTISTIAGAPVLAGASLLAAVGFVFYGYDGL